MYRREYVKKGMIGVAATIPLAGCVAGSGMDIEDVDTRTTTFGNIIVAVLVVNRTDEKQSETIVAEVDIDGGNLYTERKTVSLPPNTKDKVEIKFDIDLSESLSATRYEYNAEFE